MVEIPLTGLIPSHDPDFEHQRYQGRCYKIQREDRVCACYQMNEIGDEYHHVFSCDHFNN